MEEPGSEEELPEEEDSEKRSRGRIGARRAKRAGAEDFRAARKRHILFIAGHFLWYFVRFMLYKCKKGENLPLHEKL